MHKSAELTLKLGSDLNKDILSGKNILEEHDADALHHLVRLEARCDSIMAD